MSGSWVVLSAQRPQIETIAGHQAIAGEVLIKLRSPDIAAGREFAREFDPEKVDFIQKYRIFRIRSRSLNAAALVDRLRNREQVEWAEPNYVLRLAETIPNDPDFPIQWHLKNTGQSVNGQAGYPLASIHATDAWDVTTGSADTVVGTLDSGLNYNHPDLSANVWTATSSFHINFADGDVYDCPAGSHGIYMLPIVGPPPPAVGPSGPCDPWDDNGHGTFVAGIIGAQGNNNTGIAGINWKTSILALKVFTWSGQGDDFTTSMAIEAAVQLKQQGVNLQVLNASFVSDAGPSQALQQAIQDANDNGILFVAAAGNSSKDHDVTPVYPASYEIPNVIAVAATDNLDQLASFSDYGRQSVHLGAPGVGIESTNFDGDYSTWYGTSFAAPQVAGSAALVLSACPVGTPTLKTILLDSTDWAPALADKTITGGRLNVDRALTFCGAKSEPDFQLTSSATSLPIVIGRSGSANIALTSFGGFAQPVTLSVSGLPAGFTSSFSAPSLTSGGISILTVTVPLNASLGSFPIRIHGVSGQLSAVATINLTVLPEFTVSVTTPVLSVATGNSMTTSVVVTGAAGFAGAVGLSVTGLPLGVTATFSPGSVTGSGSSSLTFSATATARVGIYSVSVIARAVDNTQTQTTLSLSVWPPAFTVSVSPAALIVAPGGSASAAIILTPALPGSVNVSVSGVPAGVKTSITPAGGGWYNLEFDASAAAPLGVFAVTVQAAGASLVQTAKLQLTIRDLVIKLPSSITVSAGGQASLLITLGVAAPAGGLSVTLASSNSLIAQPNLTTLFIPQGQTGIKRAAVMGLRQGTVTITASGAGYVDGSTAVQVTSSNTPPLSITAKPLPPGEVGVFYSQTVAATGGLLPYRWALISGNLPNGLTLDTATGQILGTPTAATTGLLTFQVTDASVPPQSATAALTLAVSSAPSGPGIILPATISVGVGAQAALIVSLSGAAPAGGVTVTLVSSNPTVAGLNLPSVFLPKGQTGMNRAKVTGLKAGTTTITASAPGYQPSTTTVKVGP